MCLGCAVGLLCLAVFTLWPGLGGFWIELKVRQVILFSLLLPMIQMK